MNGFIKVLFLKLFVIVAAQNYNRKWMFNMKIPQNRLLLHRLLRNNEYALMNFTQRSTKYGFNSEIHTVVTEDGYILKMFRLIQPRCAETKKPPVLLNHGAFLNSISWIDNPPETSLAYLIADSCYDLWLGNSRGTEYSRGHVRMDPMSDPAYWQFSFHEMGIYDLPKFVDHILEITGSEKVNFIGHSQGAGEFFILTSLRPEYMQKFGVSISLAPGTFMKHTNSFLLRFLYNIRHFMYVLLTGMGIHEVTTVDSIVHDILFFLCRTNSLSSTCAEVIFTFIDGRHDNSISNDTFVTLIEHMPDSVSLKTFFHFTQSMTVSKFRQFDYGDRTNRMVYGANYPPDYNLSNITTPVAILYGKNDRFINSTDIETLESKLPNVIDFHCIDNLKWNHIDFLWSKYIPQLLYPKVNEYLSKYSFSSL